MGCLKNVTCLVNGAAQLYVKQQQPKHSTDTTSQYQSALVQQSYCISVVVLQCSSSIGFSCPTVSLSKYCYAVVMCYSSPTVSLVQFSGAAVFLCCCCRTVVQKYCDTVVLLNHQVKYYDAVILWCSVSIALLMQFCGAVVLLHRQCITVVQWYNTDIVL